MSDPKCFKHKRRTAFAQWRVCSDGPWRPICKECDLELNKLGLRWAYPKEWKSKFEDYKKRVTQ